MFNPKHLINWAANPQKYVWIEARLLKQTPGALKILFDGKKIWLPKAWIAQIKRDKAHNMIKIYISQYCWAKGR